MSEQKLQKKILDWLKANGFWVFKTIVCNRKGIMDIVACSPKGKFVGIEVKLDYNKPTKLQAWNISEVCKCNGIAFVAYDLETVKETLKDELI